MRAHTSRSRGLPGVAVMLMLTAACSGAPDHTPTPAAVSAAPTSSNTPSAAPAAEDPVWHYEGAEGPEHWSTLSPAFATCGAGRSQSPIDITDPSPAGGAAPVGMSFPPSMLKVAHHAHVADGINNGHTIQINYGDDADTLTLGGDAYKLAQYHFHGPSEHTIKGKRSAMEMHLVHKAQSGALAVVGVLIDEGAHNAAFDPVWANLPAQKGIETHYAAVTVDVDALLPTIRTSYRYDGSLTTPPCSEGVKWIVMTTPIQLSADQIRAFTHIIHDNSRPTQPRNGRRVVSDVMTVTSSEASK